MSINRYRGDTHRQVLVLSKNGELLDLDLTSKIEFSYVKKGVLKTILCLHDINPLTGRVEIPFELVDVETAGNFKYDLQVTWLDNTVTTFDKSLLSIKKDINTN